MTKISAILDFLETIAPLRLAEEWDNVGLLLGDRHREIDTALTCLTVTPETVAEAMERRAGLIVSHHPFPFFAEKKWTADTATGALLLSLTEAKIAVYSPHTAHDSAAWGINRQLAAMLDLTNVEPLRRLDVLADPSMLAGLGDETVCVMDSELGRPLGCGRLGRLRNPMRLGELLATVRRLLNLDSLLWTGDFNQRVEKLAIACGAADDFLDDAVRLGADAFLLGETKFHHALLARQSGLALIVPGHFATEYFAAAVLARRMAHYFPDLAVYSAESETDPFRTN